MHVASRATSGSSFVLAGAESSCDKKFFFPRLISVGSAVGWNVGRPVGCGVGTPDGCGVGSAVGASEGSAEGAAEGANVGRAVGASEGGTAATEASGERLREGRLFVAAPRPSTDCASRLRPSGLTGCERPAWGVSQSKFHWRDSSRF